MSIGQARLARGRHGAAMGRAATSAATGHTLGHARVATVTVGRATAVQLRQPRALLASFARGQSGDRSARSATPLVR